MKYICFDIGGTKIKYGIIDDNYTIIEKKDIDTEAYLGGRQIVNKIITIINEYKVKYELNGVAISTAGVVDANTGTIIYANDIIPNYTNTNLSKIIFDNTGLITTAENDVNCFALSHVLSVDSDFLMVAIGTGIGGAIVIDKKIYHGITNSAGEFGQMVINKKRFEEVASVSALVKYAQSIGLNAQSGIEIFNLYDKNEKLAITAVNYFLENLALGILNLSYIFNFPKIILGGGITNRKSFLNELNEKIKLLENAPYNKSKIIVSKNTNDGGMLGALVHHLNMTKK